MHLPTSETVGLIIIVIIKGERQVKILETLASFLTPDAGLSVPSTGLSRGLVT
jgi:hypothetical protein